MSTKCGACGELIVQGKIVRALDSVFHKACFVCVECKKPLEGGEMSELGGKPLCLTCANAKGVVTAALCEVCSKPLAGSENTTDGNGQKVHVGCFLCAACSKPLQDSFIMSEKKPYHLACTKGTGGSFSNPCHLCEKPLTGRCVMAGPWVYHEDCYEADCKKATTIQSLFRGRTTRTSTVMENRLDFVPITQSAIPLEKLRRLSLRGNDEVPVLFPPTSSSASAPSSVASSPIVPAGSLHPASTDPSSASGNSPQLTRQPLLITAAPGGAQVARPAGSTASPAIPNRIIGNTSAGSSPALANRDIKPLQPQQAASKSPIIGGGPASGSLLKKKKEDDDASASGQGHEDGAGKEHGSLNALRERGSTNTAKDRSPSKDRSTSKERSSTTIPATDAAAASAGKEPTAVAAAVVVEEGSADAGNQDKEKEKHKIVADRSDKPLPNPADPPKKKKKPATEDDSWGSAVEPPPQQQEEEEVLPLPATPEDLRAELKHIKGLLSTAESAWGLRVKAMHRLEAVVRFVELPMGPGPDLRSWIDEVRLMSGFFGLQFNDLRSSIVREISRLTIALANVLGEPFAEIVAAILPNIAANFYVTVKVIAESSLTCGKVLVQTIPSTMYVGLLLEGFEDKHDPVRTTFAEYLGIIITRNGSLPLWTDADNALIIKIEQAITTLNQDKAPATRKSTRDLFRAYRAQWKDRAEVLFNSFDARTQKLIKDEDEPAKPKTPAKNLTTPTKTDGSTGASPGAAPRISLRERMLAEQKKKAEDAALQSPGGGDGAASASASAVQSPAS